MAVAMIGGLALGTVATLLVVPALHGLALPRRGRAATAGLEPGLMPAE
jgi:Cu/Ag efflux pump CusA